MKSEEHHKLLQPEVINFVKKHIQFTAPELILKGSPFPDIDIKTLTQQIIGKQKARKKLPTWHSNNHIIYPPKLNLEQTSSEITALHKSKLVSGECLLDMTGGFGIDSYYFSKRVHQLFYAEINNALFDVARHNFEVLGVRRLKAFQHDSIEVLKQLNMKFNWIYIDPSRRIQQQKVFQLQESIPNPIENFNLLRKKSVQLMIKTSPMYDLRMGFKELSGVKELHIVSVKNEVKELLWIIDWQEHSHPEIKMYNYQSPKIYTYHTQHYNTTTKSNVTTSKPKTYLYEFHAGIMKSGLYDELAKRYHLRKLEQQTHLFTSDQCIQSFPGHIFKVEHVGNIQYKQLKKRYKQHQVNILAKNFPLSTAEIQKKLQCKIGSREDFLIFVKSEHDFIVIKALKLK